MPGLIDEGLTADQTATTGLGEAALNSSREFISNLQAKQADKAGWGEIAGLAGGYALARKKPGESLGGKPGVPSTPAQDAGKGSGLGMMMGTMGQKILPGFLQNRQQVGSTTSTAPIPYSQDVGLGDNP
jgi:hypothetical protein